jgi:hypothetical protein
MTWYSLAWALNDQATKERICNQGSSHTERMYIMWTIVSLHPWTCIHAPHAHLALNESAVGRWKKKGRAFPLWESAISKDDKRLQHQLAKKNKKNERERFNVIWWSNVVLGYVLTDMWATTCMLQACSTEPCSTYSFDLKLEHIHWHTLTCTAHICTHTYTKLHVRMHMQRKHAYKIRCCITDAPHCSAIQYVAYKAEHGMT